MKTDKERNTLVVQCNHLDAHKVFQPCKSCLIINLRARSINCLNKLLDFVFVKINKHNFLWDIQEKFKCQKNYSNKLRLQNRKDKVLHL